MTRAEYENKVLEKLAEIQGIVRDILPEDEAVCISVRKDSYWAFVLNVDENGEAICGDYILNVYHSDEEESA